MSGKRVGVLHAGLILLGISLTPLATIVTAIGNIVLAGPIAIPGASFAALEQPGPLLTQEHDDDLELSMLSSWMCSATSWQRVCASLEQQLPTIMTRVAEQLHTTQSKHADDTARATTLCCLLTNWFSDKL